jgi:hypothetical protein
LKPDLFRELLASAEHALEHARGKTQAVRPSHTRRDAGMRKSKRHALEAHGWRVSSVADFLELTPEEVGVVQLALLRSDAPRARRVKLRECHHRRL